VRHPRQKVDGRVHGYAFAAALDARRRRIEHEPEFLQENPLGVPCPRRDAVGPGGPDPASVCSPSMSFAGEVRCRYLTDLPAAAVFARRTFAAVDRFKRTARRDPRRAPSAALGPATRTTPAANGASTRLARRAAHCSGLRREEFAY
jgi:hypothetical protein